MPDPLPLTQEADDLLFIKCASSRPIPFGSDRTPNCGATQKWGDVVAHLFTGRY